MRRPAGIPSIILIVCLAIGLAACHISSQPGSATPTVASSKALPLSPTSTTSPTAMAMLTLAVGEPRSSATATIQPSPTASPTVWACWSQPGVVEQFSLSDRRLRLPMEYSVYLPPCYDQQPERLYPVLYLIHGQNYNNDQWDRLGVDETASRLIASGEIPPFLIVMPRDRLWEQPEKDPFGVVVVEKLIPLIDRDFRVLPGRDYRAIGGLSRGAGWAVHLGLSHWEMFGAIGAHSLPVFWSDTARVRGWLDAIPQASLPRIYLDIGEKDRPAILESARWFEGVLTDKNIPHEWYLFPGYHEEAYWSAHLEQYLRWYSAGWLNVIISP